MTVLEDKVYQQWELLEEAKFMATYRRPVKDKKGVMYYNFPCAFDIEASSFKLGEQKVALMYEWTFSLDGKVCIGRTWDEWLELCNKLSQIFDLSDAKRLVIYIHNLAYEFQAMRKLFNWSQVFSLDKRKPIYALTDLGIEFRCSYQLSGYSLETVAKNLTQFKIEKLKGDLDYSLIRTPQTPITDKELQYCVNDAQIIIAYIAERIKSDGNITNIPFTKTGYVRNHCRNACLNQKVKREYDNYKALMHDLTLTPEEYKLLQLAFSGGFTHANPNKVGQIIDLVDSFDFTSSYPYVMVSEKFPMSKSKEIQITSKSQLREYLNNYCCLFTVEFKNIISKTSFETYISKARCEKILGESNNNGRIYTAEYIKMTITEQDFDIIEKTYTWDKMRITKFLYYEKQYLPKPLVKSILDLYVAKTTLKDVEGKEIEYLESKERVNACYGMMVTDICRDEIIYDNNWDSHTPDLEEAISRYNKSRKRFLYYPWGIWVTAYARHNLWSGILEFKNDYCYSDTDSVKVQNLNNHLEYIENYNNEVIKKLKDAMEFQGLDFELTCPKTIKGEVKQLGIWEHEKPYEKFKTLGAKRYMVKQHNALRTKDGQTYDYSFTVAGCNKIYAIPYMLKQYGEKIFDEFKDGLIIPSTYTGKSTHTYIDEEVSGSITDYLGQTYDFKSPSGTHLEPAEYSLSIAESFKQFLLGIKIYINGGKRVC